MTHLSSSHHLPIVSYCVDVWELCWSHLYYHHGLGHVYTTTLSPQRGKVFLCLSKSSLFKRRRCQTDANSQGSTILTENARQSSSWRCAERVMHSHPASLLPVHTETNDSVFRVFALEHGFRFIHSRHRSCVNERHKRNQSLPFSAIFIVV